MRRVPHHSRTASGATVAGACLLLLACNDAPPPAKHALSAPSAAAAANTAAAPVVEVTPIIPTARVPLDSGNVLFRAKAYAGALLQYREAARRDPAHAAPLFGIYMVAQAQGNVRLADSALAGIRKRTPESPTAATAATVGGSPHTVSPIARP